MEWDAAGAIFAGGLGATHLCGRVFQHGEPIILSVQGVVFLVHPWACCGRVDDMAGNGFLLPVQFRVASSFSLSNGVDSSLGILHRVELPYR